MRLLIVEDDDLLGKALKAGLVGAGYAPDWVQDGESALDALRSHAYSAVILDINLPGLSGLDVLKSLRRRDDLPVLIMTARDGLDARIEGLDLGADDYIVKPFALEELLARLRAVHRRALGRSQTLITFGDLEMDIASRTVHKAGERVKLTARELQVLSLLLERIGRVVSKTEIETQVYSWDGNFESNTVEAAVYSLRKKLGRDLIETLRGIGYIINGQS